MKQIGRSTRFFSIALSILVMLNCFWIQNDIFAEPANFSKDQNLNQLLDSVNDLVAYYKAACIEQGGCSQMQALVGRFAAWLILENTYHISEYSQIRYQTAVVFSQITGIETKRYLKTLPDINMTEEYVWAILAHKIMINYLADSKFDHLLTNEESDSIYRTIYERFRQTEPHRWLLGGAPRTNGLSKFFFGDKSIKQ